MEDGKITVRDELDAHEHDSTRWLEAICVFVCVEWMNVGFCCEGVTLWPVFLWVGSVVCVCIMLREELKRRDRYSESVCLKGKVCFGIRGWLKGKYFQIAGRCFACSVCLCDEMIRLFDIRYIMLLMRRLIIGWIMNCDGCVRTKYSSSIFVFYYVTGVFIKSTSMLDLCLLLLLLEKLFSFVSFIISSSSSSSSSPSSGLFGGNKTV